VSSLTLVAVVHLAMMAGGESNYAEAHKTTTETGKPMLVLVGANWCPACLTMKNNVMPQVVRTGLFGRCVYTVVDLDEQKTLGQELTKGGPIPQLIMFRKTGDGWLRRRLVGGQSVSTVVKFIDDGVNLDEQEKQKGNGSGDAADEDRQAAVKAPAANAKTS
jgi:thioredoxin-like negative regulator of GroEL